MIYYWATSSESATQLHPMNILWQFGPQIFPTLPMTTQDTFHWSDSTEYSSQVIYSPYNPPSHPRTSGYISLGPCTHVLLVSPHLPRPTTQSCGQIWPCKFLSHGPVMLGYVSHLKGTKSNRYILSTGCISPGAEYPPTYFANNFPTRGWISLKVGYSESPRFIDICRYQSHPERRVFLSTYHTPTFYYFIT